MKNFFKRLIIILMPVFFFGCTENKPGKEYSDTTTSGTISIAVDEAFMPLIQSQITAFQGTYTKAKILAYYVSEKRAFEMLMHDSVRLVVSRRGFSDAEKDSFKLWKISPKTLKIATDAIGVVLHPGATDTLLTTDHLISLLTTENASWRILSDKSKDQKVMMVLDKEGSSNVYSLLDKLQLKMEDIKCPVSYAGGDREVINFVNQHPGSMGFIGVNWISDPDDPTQMRFKQGVKVAHLMSDTLLKQSKMNLPQFTEEYYQPLQAYLAQHFYPLTREVVVASREARAGLGTGFMAWMAGDKGQRIVLKAGLLPATMPIRLVKIKKDSDLTN